MLPVQRMPAGCRTGDHEFNAGLVLLGIHADRSRPGKGVPGFRTETDHGVITRVAKVENLLVASFTQL